MKFYTLLYPKNRDLKYRNPKIIKTEIKEESALSSCPEIKDKIEKQWKKLKKRYKKLFNGTLYRLSGFKQKHGKLILRLASTNFKELMGTNHLFFFDKKNFDYLKRLGRKENDCLKYFSNGLSVGAVIQTKDDYVLIVKRGKKTESYPSTFYTVAGYVEPKKDKTMEDAVSREIEEEIGLNKDEYKIYFLGLIRNNQTLKPELIYLIKAKKNLAEILTGKDEFEEFDLIFGLKKEDLKKFLKSFPEKKICPLGLAAWKMYLKIERRPALEI